MTEAKAQDKPALTLNIQKTKTNAVDPKTVVTSPNKESA